MAREKKSYANVRVSYDIETTSYRDGDPKTGVKKTIVYSYALCIDGVVERYRYRAEYMARIQDLAFERATTFGCHLVVYVHHLAYEYGFMRCYFDWEDVFPIADRRKVVRATTTSGIEFRCSYALTNKGLADVGDEVGVKKMVGDLDYNEMRHSGTKLTDEEIGYIDNDVLIIDELIKQRLQRDSYSTIPMTKTGYVRRLVAKAVRNDPEAHQAIKSMVMTTEDYLMAKEAFSGGYTHANADYSGVEVKDVGPFDLSSAYLGIMVRDYFPMSSFMNIDPSDVADNWGKLAMLLDVTLEDVECRYKFGAISKSKCTELVGGIIDNGRVHSATSLRTVVTDVELNTIRRNYDCKVTVNVAKAAAYGRLPKPVVETVLNLYVKKTTLKGVEGMETEYGAYKEDGNSVYGMVSTDPVKVKFTHTGNGNVEVVETDLDEEVANYNKSRSRSLFYPWGAWVTAHTRALLLGTIMDLADAGVVVLYCDTDSTYSIWCAIMDAIIKAVNEKLIKKNEEAAADLGLDPQLFSPLDPKGIAHPIGIFEHDNKGKNIDSFKTLGAKRYAMVKNGEFSITVAGLNKKKGAKYVAEMGGMDFFKDGMTIPAEHSGRLVHTYSDDLISNIMIDKDGLAEEVEQEGFVHLESASYKMTVGDEYKDFMQLFNMD